MRISPDLVGPSEPDQHVIIFHSSVVEAGHFAVEL